MVLDTPYVNVSEDIEIKVYPVFQPDQSKPEISYYYFTYVVVMTNLGSRNVRLERRRWEIRDGNKKKDVVEGAGVVGQFPELKPGESFRYQSFSPLSTPTGSMRGNYLFKDIDTNQYFKVEVPVFFLRTHDKLINNDNSHMYQRIH